MVDYDDPKKQLSTGQAARIAKVSQGTIHTAIKTGKLKATIVYVRSNGLKVHGIRKSDLYEWIDSRKLKTRDRETK
jgi:predicted DNA-binding protein (UPF0251 family)